MTTIHWLAALGLSLGLGLFTSCIKEEALNAECDITGVDPAWLADNSALLVGPPIVTNDHVSFSIQKGADRTALAPVFTLTEGAHITMTADDGSTLAANGAVRNFSTPQTYTVHSEDGLWRKDYSVAFNYPKPIDLCSFEHYELDKSGRYHVWYEVDAEDVANPRRDYWASGNPGYALTGMGHSYTMYPTSSDPLGVQGNCVKLVTCSTGSFGQMVGMPIAAGNLFIGEFRTQYAMQRPREATHFGMQLVGGRPLRLEGWYKYTAGTTFTDAKQQVRPELHDTCDIYAVLYAVDPEVFVSLNGNDVLTSERIVSLARIDKPGEPQEWTFFSEPFVERKAFDEERLRTDGYAIAIVMTSSRQGAYFEGAVGSTLYVDEVRIVWEGEEE